MIVSTWNINSVRLRIGHVLRFLGEYSPDILCLQETRCTVEQFPAEKIRHAGYTHLAISGEPGRNGVAVISRIPFTETHIRRFAGKADCRHIATTLKNGICVHNLYVPAGGYEPDRLQNDKFAHKLDFLDDMAAWCAGFGTESRTVLAGDLNVAPGENDVWSHRQMRRVVSHTPAEVDRLLRIMDAHCWTDSIRTLAGGSRKLYTWWSYRAKDWRTSGRGRRLDHIWVSPSLKKAALSGEFGIHEDIRGWERPSDHVPVSVKLSL